MAATATARTTSLRTLWTRCGAPTALRRAIPVAKGTPSSSGRTLLPWNQLRRWMCTAPKRESTGFAATYSRALATNPKLTKSSTGAVLFGAGDFFAQQIEGKEFDVVRMLRSAVYGFVLSGPMNHYQFAFLDHLFTRVIVGWSPNAVLLGKLCLDQFVYFSWAIIASYFIFMGFAQGHSVDQVTENVSQNLFSTVQRGWVFWIPVQVINFKWMPVAYQTIFVMGASFIWALYISWYYTKKSQEVAAAAIEDGAPDS